MDTIPRYISIHVPAWGTTFRNWCIHCSFCISIHVPAWGTTCKTVYITVYSKISIHVPAWGTTLRHCTPHSLLQISIHVPAWGTTRGSIWHMRSCRFQSTFPRGERPCFFKVSSQPLVFQSTFPRGERQVGGMDMSKKEIISIHVPAWGTTTFENWQWYCNCISIHVPAWGTTWITGLAIVKPIFQSTFPRGERR